MDLDGCRYFSNEEISRTSDLGNTLLTTSIIWGLDNLPSGNPTLKLLHSSTISRSVNCCWNKKAFEIFSICYVYKSSQPTFLFVSLLLGSSLTSFCFLGLLVWTTTFSSGLMITESMKSFNFSGISGSLLACLFRLFFLGDWTMFWVLQDPWRKPNFLHPRQSSWLHCLYFFLCVLLS